MFKKAMATAVLVCTIPALASASWFLKTQATSAGGSLDSRNMSGQTVLNGPKFASYTSASTNFDVTVTTNTGYTLSSLLVNGVQQVSGAGLPSPYTVTLNGSATDKSVVATFLPQMERVTASNPYGTVNPSVVGNITYNYKLTAPLTFTFMPAAGYKITDITGIPGASNGTPVKSAPGGVNQKATVTFPAGYIFTGNVSMSAVGSIGVNSLPQLAPVTFVIGGSAKTIAAPAPLLPVANPVYTWTYVSGPNNSASYTSGKLTSANDPASFIPGPALGGFDANNQLAGPSFSFTAPAAPAQGTNLGQYKFKLAVTSSTDSSVKLNSLVVVNVVSAASNSAATQCQFCHSANNVRTVADTSAHASCESCHFTGASHPGSVNSGTVSAASYQVNVDNVANGNGTAAPKGTNFCASCHGASGAAQPVPVLSTHQNKLCSDCHNSAHDTHVASTACQVCHATVNDHTATSMGNKACLDCHDGHHPATGTQPLIGAASQHPPVTLYTFEELGMQMAGGQKVPVQVDASGKGMPYSPKQTCGTSGCHVIGGVDYSYDKISDHAFHSNQGRSEYVDNANGKFDATKNKPWTQSTAMVGKW